MIQVSKRRQRDGQEEAGAATAVSASGSPSAAGGSAMRLIVPLQGVVQGRGGLVLGSLIPCALFYFLQLYLKRNRSPSPSPSSSSSTPSPASPTSTTGDVSDLANPSGGGGGGGGMPRTYSRNILSSRGPAPISSRAGAVVKSDASPVFVGSRRCAEDPYHSVDNPEGFIQLGLAENHLSLDLLRDWIASNLKDLVPDEQQGSLSIGRLAMYQPMDGLMEMKMAVAGFMGQVMCGSVSFNPSQIVLTAGASPAIETLSFCLADPGNAILVPSPYYSGYDRIIKWRSGVEIIPVPCRSTDNFTLSISSLERAYNQAKQRGIKVRALLFSNPSNPAGNLLHRDRLRVLIDFATEKNIHIISDEVFAASTYGNEGFVSMAEVLQTDEFDKSRVHIVYGLSKDLSLPGFRVGVIYSFNENVLRAASKLARFSSVSVPTQHLLISMLNDSRFVSEYIQTNRERLRRMHRLFVDGLKELGIKCIPSSSGFYCWADMSEFMRSYSEKGEYELWDKMLNVGKIHATPGTSCHCIEPGWFRLCFTTVTAKDIPVVMERIKRVIDRC